MVKRVEYAATEYSESFIIHFRRDEQLRAEAVGLSSLDLNTRQLHDLEALLNRGSYPLSSYLDQAEYEHILKEMGLVHSDVP